MPQLRSFSSFAPGGDFGASYIGGANSGTAAYKAGSDVALDIDRNKIAREGIAQRYDEASMSHQDKLAAINQQATEAQMRSQAQQQALMQEAAIKNQEIEINKHMNESKLGLAARELDQAQAKQDMAAREAARLSEVRQNATRHIMGLVQGGELPLNKAVQEAAALYPEAIPTAVARMFDGGGEGGEGGGMGPAALLPVENTEDYKYFQTGKGSRTLVPNSRTAEKEFGPMPGNPARDTYGSQSFPSQISIEAKELKKEVSDLRKNLLTPDWEMQKRAYSDSQDPKKAKDLSEYKKKMAKEYEDQLATIRDKQSRLDKLNIELTPAYRAQIPAAVTQGGSTNQIGRFKVISH